MQLLFETFRMYIFEGNLYLYGSKDTAYITAYEQYQ